MTFPPARKIGNALRFRAAKLRKGTVRYYCGNLPAFYTKLEAEGLRPLVLRWADDVPLTPEQEQKCPHDVDHLIADDTAARIGQIAAAFPGPVKCDFYSVSGQSGSAYKAYPYYPPVLALDLLDHAIKDSRGFWRPDPLHEYYAFAYHLCYHKGHRSGLALGYDTQADTPASRDYASELRRLASLADQSPPDPLTLRSLHEALCAAGWNMPEDLVTRWPDQHEALRQLAKVNTSSLTDLAAIAKDLTVFVLRADCDTDALRDAARAQISTRFKILREVELTGPQVEAMMRKTRGGNWIEKYCKCPVPPTHAIICRNAQTPGPLPDGMTPDKMRARYPHVHHSDVLIKRDIRQALNQRIGAGANRVLLHATDNPEETVITLQAVYGAKTEPELRALATHDT